MNGTVARFALSVLSVVLMAGPAQSQITGELDKALEVAKQIRANQEAIRTWTGTARITTARDTEAPSLTEVRELKFLWQADGDQLAYSGKSEWNSKDKKQIHPFAFLRNRDASFEKRPGTWDPRTGKVVRWSISEEPISVTKGNNLAHFDPMGFLLVGSRTPAEHLEYFSTGGTQTVVQGTMKTEGNLFTVTFPEIMSEAGGKPVGSSYGREVFDTSMGGLPVLIESKTMFRGMTRTTRSKLDYEKVGDVWLLSRCTHERTDQKGLLTLKAELTDSRINVDIPEGTFSRESLETLSINP